MSIDINKYVNNYEFDYTLPGSNEVIMFKPITAGQLKKMLIYENETNVEIIENVLDTIISESVISEGFDINKLYIEDRFALLVEMRKKSKSEIYDFLYVCPECKKPSDISIDLNSLKTIKKNNNNEPFKVSDNLSFDIDQITREEQKIVHKKLEELEEKSETYKNIQKSAFSHAISMRTFHTPEGDTDDVSFETKLNLLDGVFTEKQYIDYVKWFDDNKFGIDFKFDFSCNSCGYKDNFNIPLNNFFV